MEIERKFLIREIPENLDTYPHKDFCQGYLSTEPVVRVRSEEDAYFLTYKSRGLLQREEYNLPLTEEAFLHLLKKADANIIRKTRYFIPIEGTDLTIELDLYKDELAPLVTAEVEFKSVEEATAFLPPEWFSEDVTESGLYQNSRLSTHGLPAEYFNH